MNAYTVAFSFDSIWDGLDRTAVFQAGDSKISVILDDTNQCQIPWEVLENPRRTLEVGVYGTRNGTVVLPTVWVSLGEIKQGVSLGDNNQPPTPDVYSQILQVAKDAEDVAQSVRDDADSGKFNGEQGPTGPQGYTYTPAVSEKGVISWTNDGSLPNPSPVNITGPQGETGETPDITVGTVETLEPGQDATAEITGETPNLVLNLGIPKGQPGADAPQINDQAVTATNPWSSKNIVDRLCPPFEVEGNLVTCTPVEGYPLGVQVSWEPTQEGEGDPSPENVRPISGRESVMVTRCGRNVMPQQEKVGAYHGVSITWHGDGSVSIFGQSTKTFYIVGPYFYAPKGTYYAYINQPATKLGIQYTEIKYINKQITMDGISPCRYIVNFDEGDIVDETIYTMLSAGAKAPEKWEPYQGNDYALTLPETIYGGTLDTVTGVGEETWGFVAFDGTETWTQYSGSTGDGINVFVIMLADTGLGFQTSICNQFKNVDASWGNNTPWTYSDYPTTRNKYFCVSKSKFPDVDSWKSYLAAQYAAGTPVQVCYKLDTPQPIQATGGQTIPALSGTNTIYADGDNIQVSGRADPLALIQTMQSQIAALNEAVLNQT